MVPVTLTLFDIDGTLLCGDGSGRAAMSQAAGELFGRPDMFDSLSFAGAVDSSIVRAAIAGVGIEPTARRVARLHGRYVRRLKRRLHQSPGRRCPGVPEMVSAAKEVSQVGLITGNWSDGARAKLEALGLWDDFSGCVGAFGGDALDRNDLVPIAVKRARRRWGTISRVVVIGDTPADVWCAKAGDTFLRPSGVEVFSIVVETGFATKQSLTQSGPDLQVPNMVDGQGAMLGLISGHV